MPAHKYPCNRHAVGDGRDRYLPLCTGESYAGVYVPTLVRELLTMKGSRRVCFWHAFGACRRRTPRGSIGSEGWRRKDLGETRLQVPSYRPRSSAFAVAMLRGYTRTQNDLLGEAVILSTGTPIPAQSTRRRRWPRWRRRSQARSAHQGIRCRRWLRRHGRALRWAMTLHAITM